MRTSHRCIAWSGRLLAASRGDLLNQEWLLGFAGRGPSLQGAAVDSCFASPCPHNSTSHGCTAALCAGDGWPGGVPYVRRQQCGGILLQAAVHQDDHAGEGEGGGKCFVCLILICLSVLKGQVAVHRAGAGGQCGAACYASIAAACAAPAVARANVQFHHSTAQHPNVLQWAGFIKDYDGGTLMECRIHPSLPYADFPGGPFFCVVTDSAGLRAAGVVMKCCIFPSLPYADFPGGPVRLPSRPHC